jgi:hypothetical protein
VNFGLALGVGWTFHRVVRLRNIGDPTPELSLRDAPPGLVTSHPEPRRFSVRSDLGGGQLRHQTVVDRGGKEEEKGILDHSGCERPSQSRWNGIDRPSTKPSGCSPWPVTPPTASGATSPRSSPDRRPGPTGYSRQGQRLTAMPFICRTLSSIWCWVEGSCCSAAVLTVPRREAPDR